MLRERGIREETRSHGSATKVAGRTQRPTSALFRGRGGRSAD